MQTDAAPSRPGRGRALRRDWRPCSGAGRRCSIALLVVLAVVGQAISPEFLTTNLSPPDRSTTSSEVALIALPLTLVIVAAEIDLSVASVLGLSSALLGLPVEPRLADGDDHPDRASSPARCAAPSTACWSPGSGCRRWP